MTADGTLRISTGIVAAVLVLVAVYYGTDVLAPLALAFLIISIVWPLQQRLQSRLPALVALALTIIVTAVVCLAFASLAALAFGRVGRSLIADASRYQALYDTMVAWLEDRGVSVAGLWAEHFNTGWLLRTARQVTERVNTTLSFWIVTLVYIMLGLLEVDDARRKVQALGNQDAARILIDATAATAVKFRKYMLVRTQMSVVTGLLIWALAWITGLQFAAEWGIIAFVLNYVPFIGPLIATLFPILLEMTQFSTWQAVLGIFLGLNLIQFVVGSYIEPRVSGDVLSISPFVVLFAVFFWTFMWGLFGAFIGVPIVIAILTFCSYHPGSRFIADLLGGPVQAAEARSPNRNP
jgi:predicted PurR-regulated permease PerM